ncbi:MAG: ribosomal protein S18-alanine N-acetyltransferase [Eubacteriales bacterium]|nr:ribosomal protein S18-alanine N-acetyltransferase [Eubacteriales bacterium]
MIAIKKMTKEHIEQVYSIEEKCFSIPWSKKSFEKEINENKMAIYLVALKDEQVVGYAGMWHVINEGHITNVAVSPEYRRQGIGESLVNKLIEIAKEKEMIGLTLEVRTSNEIAKNLYKKQGFLLDGIRKEYYENKEDAFIMWKNL